MSHFFSSKVSLTFSSEFERISSEFEGNHLIWSGQVKRSSRFNSSQSETQNPLAKMEALAVRGFMRGLCNGIYSQYEIFFQRAAYSLPRVFIHPLSENPSEIKEGQTF